MLDSVLAQKTMPYCPGCGHGVATKHMGSALDRLGVNPLDLVVVSDIGCCGLVDGLLHCHTVHGLHGRAVALATGIRLAMGSPGKVVAIQGDGGATIGLQHLLDAARRNVDVTAIVQNNMVYGMTGGQPSGLSPRGFKGGNGQEGVRAYDICELAALAGASFAARTFVGRDTPELWTEALGTRGFSLVEIVGMCPAHGVQKVKDLESVAEYPAVTHRSPRPVHDVPSRGLDSLFDELTPISPQQRSTLKGPIGVVLAGSAGERVQSAAQLLASAAMVAGLHATKKGEYPITVGTGYSVAEVILSPNPIRYTAIEQPHVVIAVSADGLRHVAERIHADTVLYVDDTLSDRPTASRCTAAPFRKRAGAKSAAIAAVARWLHDSAEIPLDALIEAIRPHPQAGEMHPAIDSILR